MHMRSNEVFAFVISYPLLQGALSLVLRAGPHSLQSDQKNARSSTLGIRVHAFMDVMCNELIRVHITDLGQEFLLVLAPASLRILDSVLLLQHHAYQ
eukprot:1145354-Pelagomonas_calceolata.AAC.2